MINVLKIRFDCFPFSEGFIDDELFCGEHDIQTYLYCKNRLNVDFFPDINLLCEEQAGRTGWFRRIFNDFLKQRFVKNRILKKMFLADVPALVGQMKARNIHLVHSHFMEEAVFACEIKKRVDLPLVMSFHGGYDTHVFPALNPVVFSQTVDQAKMCLARSLCMKRHLVSLGVNESKVNVLYRGIDTDYWTRKEVSGEDGCLHVAFAGRLVEKKGVLVFLKAILPLMHQHKRLHVHIVGDNEIPYVIRLLKHCLYQLKLTSFIEGDQFVKEKVHQAVNFCPDKNRITMHGVLSRDDVRAVYSKCSVVVVPSFTSGDGDCEGIPGVALEAMAMGCAVIASDHEGIGEIVKHDHNGLLTCPGRVDMLRDQIGHLINDPDQCLFLGQNARQTIKDVCDKKSQDRLLSRYYADCLG